VNELKAVVKQVLSVEMNDLESFVAEIYGQEWNIRDVSDLVHRAEVYLTVDGKLSEYSVRDMEAWLEYAGPIPTAWTVLNHLTQRKLIEPGEYHLYTAPR